MAANTITVYSRALHTIRRTWPATSVALALAAALALSACGSGQSTTASTLDTAPARSSSQPSGTPQRTTQAPSATVTKTAPRAAQPSIAPTHRSAPAPAFTRQSGSSEGLSGAVRVLGAYGFTASDTSTYNPDHTLRVLVGKRTGSSDGYAQQAFFFADERYLGTDASAASAAIKVVSEADTEVTLAYALYRPNDSLCCPSGGEANVRFQLNNGRLQALDPIPPASSTTAAGRNKPGG